MLIASFCSGLSHWLLRSLYVFDYLPRGSLGLIYRSPLVCEGQGKSVVLGVGDDCQQMYVV